MTMAKIDVLDSMLSLSPRFLFLFNFSEYKIRSCKVKHGLTKRAVDLWDSARFTSIFLASSFSCSQAFSQPAHKPLPITCSVKAFQESCPRSTRESLFLSRFFSSSLVFLFLGNASPPPTRSLFYRGSSYVFSQLPF